MPSVNPVRDDALARERLARRLAEDQNRRKDEFVVTVVHELRQPLAPMVAALELMKRRESREIGERARQVVEKQLAQLTRLIEDLMEARIRQVFHESAVERIEILRGGIVRRRHD